MFRESVACGMRSSESEPFSVVRARSCDTCLWTCCSCVSIWITSSRASTTRKMSMVLWRPVRKCSVMWVCTWFSILVDASSARSTSLSRSDVASAKMLSGNPNSSAMEIAATFCNRAHMESSSLTRARICSSGRNGSQYTSSGPRVLLSGGLAATSAPSAPWSSGLIGLGRRGAALGVNRGVGAGGGCGSSSLPPP